MKLKDLTKELLAIESQGSNGNMEVFIRDSRSGDCSRVYGGRITNQTDDQGPFDLEDGEFYFCLTADH